MAYCSRMRNLNLYSSLNAFYLFQRVLKSFVFVFSNHQLSVKKHVRHSSVVQIVLLIVTLEIQNRISEVASFYSEVPLTSICSVLLGQPLFVHSLLFRIFN